MRAHLSPSKPFPQPCEAQLVKLEAAGPGRRAPRAGTGRGAKGAGREGAKGEGHAGHQGHEGGEGDEGAERMEKARRRRRRAQLLWAKGPVRATDPRPLWRARRCFSRQAPHC